MTEIPYPPVLDEWATVRAVLAGKSLARLGDGEFKHVYGSNGTRPSRPSVSPKSIGPGRQGYDPALSLEMRMLLVDPHPNCIVGIPTMDPRGPKYPNWLRHRARFAIKLSPWVQYYSAFVTRPDSAPWIENREFCELFQECWAGKRVVIVEKKEGGKVLPAVRYAASRVHHIRCHATNAYRKIAVLEAAILDARPELVMLSCGPTATVLANRLAGKGIQAIDIGSAGAFLLRHLGPVRV